ncbi:tRNA1(Val) (adenine(37)-N6)-methyltransferase [Caprobacter fermentans]|uniref:tRNA1(Val) (Adenine(37)-N6)-methyltransferase n=1 Tax=Caproicibacter fermentans TaxID=2576756 RepID=A0A6N8I2G3_9FIRM|nr:methyltransferase [Caproicibacter fermentans]MVB12264.1 tRNA1(Val) (adenine(37)-N6)-methyltransferase [Caproicibacter fermentans]
MENRGTPPFAGEPPGSGEKPEPLSAGFTVMTGKNHTFNTDTILLADFSMPRPGETCADFGTGCGVIPLLWCARSAPRRVYAVELQEDACRLARRSVRLSGLENQIEIIREDIKTLRQNRPLPLGLDLIACNPPYKPDGTGVPSAREGQRIARHEVACSFADISAAAAAFLRWGGRFFCCLRPERLCDAMATLRAAGLEPKRLRFVQQRGDKPPFLFLLQANRGGRPGMTVNPALLIESERGGWSEEMLKIYGDYKEGRE